jgi:hypothetical protein
MKRTVVVLSALALAACNGPRRINEEPIMKNGDRVPTSDAKIDAVRSRTELHRDALVSRRDSLTIEAAKDCAPAICAALSRGEIALGMNTAQVMAATRSTESTWSITRSGGSTVMVGRFPSTPPRDASGEIAIVQLADERVTTYSYREPQGIRVVSASADESADGRTRAQAAALVRDGDALLLSGNRKAALDRYDRASVLSPNDAALQYKTATLLDQELRPVEALMRYQKFLHQMELEKIRAHGDAYAKLADAIAHARERVIVLEKQSK